MNKYMEDVLEITSGNNNNKKCNLDIKNELMDGFVFNYLSSLLTMQEPYLYV